MRQTMASSTRFSPRCRRCNHRHHHNHQQRLLPLIFRRFAKRPGTRLPKAAFDGSLQEALAKPQAAENEVSQDDLRSKARDLLLQALHNGNLEKTLRKEPEEESAEPTFDLEAARLGARDLLANAANDGSLQKVFSEVRQKVRPAETTLSVSETKHKAFQLLAGAALNGRLEAAFTEAQQEKKELRMEEIRSKAQRTLFAGAFSGRLESACQQAKQMKEEKSIEDNHEAKGADKEDVEHMRNMARKTLLAGFRSGSLKTAFAQVKDNTEDATPKEEDEEDMEEIRNAARRTLISGVLSGRLEEACHQVRQEKSIMSVEDLRSRARSALVQSAANGDLEKAFLEVKESLQLEDLHLKLQKTLEDGLQSGSLRAACEKVRKERLQQAEKDRVELDQAPTDVEASRSMLQDIFSKAASNGTLASALGGLKERRASQEASKLEDMRMTMRDLISNAAQDGSLKNALVASRPQMQEPVESLRGQVRDALFDAANSGQLQKLLQETVGPAEVDPNEVEEELVSAHDDGQLQEATAKVFPTAPTTTRTPTPAPPPEAERTQLEVDDQEIELISEDVKVVMPTKPQVAKGTVRPSRRSSKLSKVEETPTPSEKMQEEKPPLLPPLACSSPLSSSSRSKRRIFGAITRAPVDIEEQKSMEAYSAAVSHAASRHSIRRLQAEAPAGLSKLVSSQQRSSSMGSPLKAASAMALDLGLDTDASTTPVAPRSLSQSGRPQRLTKFSRASSPSFLPTLSGKHAPNQPLAPSFTFGADTAKWDLSRAVF